MPVWWWWGLCGASPVASYADFPSAVPRVVKFTSGLSAVVAEEGQEATFQCVVSPSDAAVLWHKDGTQLQPSEKFVMAQSGASCTLTILGLTLDDAGQVTVEAEGASSSAALRVRGELDAGRTFRMSRGSLQELPFPSLSLHRAGLVDFGGGCELCQLWTEVICREDQVASLYVYLAGEGDKVETIQRDRFLEGAISG